VNVCEHVHACARRVSMQVCIYELVLICSRSSDLKNKCIFVRGELDVQNIRHNHTGTLRAGEVDEKNIGSP
jgi:hypothetical protein